MSGMSLNQVGTTTGEELLPSTIIIFRAKKIKPGYGKTKVERIQAAYHVAYRIKLASDFAKGVCGKFLYVDWSTPFEIVKYEDIKESVIFVENDKKRGGITNRDITNQMCQKCWSRLKQHYVIDQ